WVECLVETALLPCAQQLPGLPPITLHRLEEQPLADLWFYPLRLHFDKFELDTVRSLEETHAPPPRNGGLLQNMDTLGVELLHEGVQLIGVDGNVLHPILLFPGLALDEGRHIQRKTMQVQAIAIRARFPDDLGAERLNIKLCGFVRIMRLEVYMIEL